MSKNHDRGFRVLLVDGIVYFLGICDDQLPAIVICVVAQQSTLGYRMAMAAMIASGTWRNRIVAVAASFSDQLARVPVRVSKRTEGSQTLGDHEISPHYHDRHHGESGSKRDVAGHALELIHRLANERP